MDKASHIFGPILSRRLGWSLGLDIVPYKTCSYDCVYCECGKTNNLTIDKFSYIDPENIFKELSEKLKTIKTLDYITFSGSGEPTLNKDFPYFVKELKKRFSKYKIALLTNTSTLIYDDVYEASLLCDLYVPSMDSVLNKSFININRPTKSFNLELIKEKLINFSKEFKNTMWVEVFFAKDVNDSVQDIEALAQYLEQITCEKIQVNTIDRPGTESWVEPIDLATINLINQKFKNLKFEFIAKKNVTNLNIDKNKEQIKKSILNTIKRRPLSFYDILATFKLQSNEAKTLLNELSRDNKILEIKTNEISFYKLK